LKYSVEIARRVKSVNGLLATPLCEYEAVRISRVWVFGSTAKGSDSPNDLDVLIELKPCGRRRKYSECRPNKVAARSGYEWPVASEHECLKWLTKGMRLVSRHLTRDEGAKFDIQKMIYPRYEMDAV